MSSDRKQPESQSDAPAMPSLVGITPEQLQAILATLGTTSATAMREALRSQRKENPFYHERSVFNPRGVFDDDGKPLAAKQKLSRPTFFVGVRLSEETLTEEEIELCNRFTKDREAQNGKWKATIEQQGNKQRLLIDVPSRTVDDRMGLPSFALILRELLDGAESINPKKLVERIAELEQTVKSLAGSAA